MTDDGVEMFGAPVKGEAVVWHGPDDSHLAGYQPRRRWGRTANGKPVCLDDLKERAMTTALETRKPTDDAIEQVLVNGDLSKLTPQQRVSYYNSVCASLDLNPLTKPFSYISLNGKLVLYALKDCTEQLRSKRSVSVTIAAREVAEDCYVVTARASLPAGRQDESIGAVSIGGLKGENRANAMMKAETKAKRRVTLSICGLGMLDETEIETIHHDEPRGYVVHAPRVTEAPPAGNSVSGAPREPEKLSAPNSGDSGTHSDEGPDLGTDLPPGAKRIVRVEPKKGGSEGRIIFHTGEEVLTYKAQLVALAEQWCQEGIAGFPELKKSASGNFYLIGLAPIPANYEPPAPVVELTASEIPF